MRVFKVFPKKLSLNMYGILYIEKYTGVVTIVRAWKDVKANLQEVYGCQWDFF